MTTAEFRKNQFLADTVREWQETETWTHAMAALINDGPLKRREQGNAERILGRVEGYEECFDRLRSLGIFLSRARIDNEEVVDIEEETHAGR